jgi:predicted PhzF superfamily epimerase YddE/YHI9
MSGSYEFVQLDVFTKTPLTGNPLAIFTDARGLTDEQMQALAREMNLSETTFILPREPQIEAEEGKRVRIFTVEEELPFAGHPTLGTALYLQSTAAPGADEIVLDLNVGKIVSDSALTQITGAIVSRVMSLARCVSAIQSLAPRCRQTKLPVRSEVRKSQQNGQAKSCRQDCLLPLCRFATRRLWQT